MEPTFYVKKLIVLSITPCAIYQLTKTWQSKDLAENNNMILFQVS